MVSAKNILVLCLLLAMGTSVSAYHEATLFNPGFEASAITFLPWTKVSVPSTTIWAVALAPLEKNSGLRSLRLNSPGLGYANEVEQLVHLEPGATYKVSGAMKTELARGTCRLGLKSGGFAVDNQTARVSGFTDWRVYEKEVWIPNITGAKFTLTQSSNAIGSCFFDDLGIEKISGNGTPDGPTEPENTKPGAFLQADTARGEAPLRVRFEVDCTDSEDDKDPVNRAEQFCRVVFDAATSTSERGQSSLEIISGNLLQGVAGTFRDDITWNWHTNNDKFVTVEYTEPGTYRALGVAKDSSGATDFYPVFITVEEPSVEENTPPVIAGIPDITLEENSHFTQTIDLFAFASDREDPDSRLDFSITAQSNTQLISCFISNNRFVNCSAPRLNSTGTSTITVKVTDTGGLSDTDTFVIRVLKAPENTPPILSGLPDVTVRENSGFQNNVIDLFPFAFDSEDPDTALGFSVINQTNPGLISCFVDQDRFMDCSAPGFNSTGVNDVTVRVTDTGGKTDSDIFRVRVEADSSGINNPPLVTGLPDVHIEENSGYSSSLIDLWAFASDDEDAVSQLDFRIVSQGNTPLIRCLIVGNRFFECEAPGLNSTGTSLVTIEAEDTKGAVDRDSLLAEVFPQDGAGSGACRLIDVDTRTIFMDEEDSELVLFTIRNRAGTDFFIEDVDVFENSQFLSIGNVGFDSFIRENSTKDLEIRLTSHSVPGDREVSVVIDLSGRFADGTNCSFSEVGRETFRVEIDNDDGLGAGVCSDIDIITRTVSIDESDTERVAFEVRNRSDSDFRLLDVDVTESSSFLSVSNVDWDNIIRENDDGFLEFSLRSSPVSRDRTEFVDIELRGEFEDGRTCSFSEAGRETFRVEIEDIGGISGVCSDISLIVSDATVPENSGRTHFVTIENDNARDFTITNVSVSGNSGFFSVRVRDEPNRVDSRDSERIELEIDAANVSRDRTGEAVVGVSGRFSNGVTCSGSSIREEFSVTVDNRPFIEDGVGPDGSVDLEFSSAFVTIAKEETRSVRATLTNGLGTSECFNLSLSNSPFISTRLSTNELCLGSGSSGTADIIITGNQAGSGNIQFRAGYGNKSKSRFLSVEVTGAGTTDGPRVSVRIPENLGENPVITLTNTGTDQRNVTVAVVNAPEGVTIRSVSVPLWRSNEEIELNVELGEGFEGNVEATIRVNADTGSRSVPLNAEVLAEEQEELFPSGFVGLATAVGIGLGMLILIVLAIIGILSVLGRKQE